MDLQIIKEIFFPEAHKATVEAEKNGNRFAYYTTAEVAYQIIESKQIWMRNTTTMNDYMEIDYGLDLLLRAYEGTSGVKLKTAIDLCHVGLADEVWNQVKAWLPGFRADTFITCISEHDPRENELGRLSMWRAYGGKTGVALIVNGAPMSLQTNALGAYSSPVSYLNQIQFCESMELVASNIENYSKEISALNREDVKNTLFTMFRFAVLCTKHPGFREEKEWRIVASPVLHPNNLLKSDVEIVHGVPQPVLKLSLNNEQAHGVVGLSVPELIERVIIGPCEFAHVTQRALWIALRDAGVIEPGKLITQSDIPLRHS